MKEIGPTLKPCPNCGSSDIDSEAFATGCMACGLKTGPYTDWGVEAWNALPRHPEPQPIETAPKDGTWILVNGKDCWVAAQWEIANFADEFATYDNATRWLPMPPLPKDGQQPSKCSRCDGSGYWIETTTSGAVPFDAERGSCARCGGSGLEPLPEVTP